MSLVLVADDEPAVLEVLSHVVEDLGHEVVKARDGEEALAMARACRPHLVVTDHMMPRLSGVELCRRLKRDAELNAVPVILLSAVLPQGAPEADAFLHKPFEITDFEALIHKSLVDAPRTAQGAGHLPGTPWGQWAARALQGPLEEARRQLRRLEAGAPVDRSVLESLRAQLESMDGVATELARPQGGALPVEPPVVRGAPFGLRLTKGSVS
ncbi:response regulator [Myxococcus stipitatus]|uniref:response regulator n=1 Tax=Myxococcus stipitatus TaxID=83455 RepID=UPI0031456EE9